MAKILMINLPLAGHTHPTLPLAKALVERGHDVSYINAEEYRAKIEGTGAAFIPYLHYPRAPTEKQKAKGMFRAAFDTAMGLEQKFDALIYEMFFYPGITIAKRLGIPAVRQFSQPAWPKSTMDNASWSFRLSSFLIDRNVMSRKNKAYMGLADQTLAKAILQDKPLLNIVYVPQIFQAERESFGSDYLFTMPVNEEVPSTQEIPYGEMKPPIVYISLGSIISNRGFCKECIRAFGGKDMTVILNTGRVQPETLGKIPKNIYAYSFVPQVEVLRHSDVFLTHCGMNSVSEAMLCGVPMVAMPFMNDQLSNAKRVVDLGIGKRVRSFPSSGRQIYHAVGEVGNDARMRSRSAELQRALKNETSLAEVIGRMERTLGWEMEC